MNKVLDEGIEGIYEGIGNRFGHKDEAKNEKSACIESDRICVRICKVSVRLHSNFAFDM